MHLEKSHYALSEAAERLGCKPHDLIHLAATNEVVLLVGVPDGIGFRTYDAHADLTETPALLEPQLLALSASQCQKIELNGRTEQSDFRTGYLISPDGNLQQLMPSYGGRLRLDHGWAFWRTYRGPYIKEIELLPERLFVVGDDVRRLLAAQKIPLPVTAEKAKQRKVKIDKAPTESSSIEEALCDLPKVPRLIPRASQIVGKNAPIEAATLEVASESPSVILRLKEVQERTGLSRSTIYDKLDPKSPRYDPSFPKRIQLSSNTVGWRSQEINAWLASRPTIAK